VAAIEIPVNADGKNDVKERGEAEGLQIIR
jgi:hypothetical protein